MAEGLEKRLPFRRVLKQMVDKIMANKTVKGVRIDVGGRLGGADGRSFSVPLELLLELGRRGASPGGGKVSPLGR